MTPLWNSYQSQSGFILHPLSWLRRCQVLLWTPRPFSGSASPVPKQEDGINACNFHDQDAFLICKLAVELLCGPAVITIVPAGPEAKHFRKNFLYAQVDSAKLASLATPRREEEVSARSGAGLA